MANHRFSKSGALLFSLSLLAGCTVQTDPNAHQAAERLFEKSLKLIVIYTDSLQTARDSARIEQLMRAFESKINAVNFELPPETDLKLTEEENDSLIKMTDRLVAARRKRLTKLAFPNDSTLDGQALIQVDSIKSLPSHNQHN